MIAGTPPSRRLSLTSFPSTLNACHRKLCPDSDRSPRPREVPMSVASPTGSPEGNRSACGGGMPCRNGPQEHRLSGPTSRHLRRKARLPRFPTAAIDVSPPTGDGTSVWPFAVRGRHSGFFRPGPFRCSGRMLIASVVNGSDNHGVMFGRGATTRIPARACPGPSVRPCGHAGQALHAFRAGRGRRSAGSARLRAIPACIGLRDVAWWIT